MGRAGCTSSSSADLHTRRTAGYRFSMSDENLSKGDKVEWNSHGSKAEGKVEKKITSDTHAAKRDVKASKDDPQYLVKSDKSGGEAVHKPDALKKKK
jgi:hypothetical protein